MAQCILFTFSFNELMLSGAFTFFPAPGNTTMYRSKVAIVGKWTFVKENRFYCLMAM